MEFARQYLQVQDGSKFSVNQTICLVQLFIALVAIYYIGRDMYSDTSITRTEEYPHLLDWLQLVRIIEVAIYTPFQS